MVILGKAIDMNHHTYSSQMSMSYQVEPVGLDVDLIQNQQNTKAYLYAKEILQAIQEYHILIMEEV